jgi:hypothetical protein
MSSIHSFPVSLQVLDGRSVLLAATLALSQIRLYNVPDCNGSVGKISYSNDPYGAAKYCTGQAA